jgi:two-component system, LytTR family, response regulator
MIKAIIIEDEFHPRKVLAKLLEKHCPQVSVESQCASAHEGLSAIRELNPDLIFLDIDMPGMNGMEMLKQLDEIEFDIIFTTAHDEFALEAFKVSPMDYLLKPIVENDLVEAVARVEKKRKRLLSKEQFELLLTNLHSTEDDLQKLAIPSHEAMEFVDIMDIVRCEADRNYTMIYTIAGDKHLFSRTLKDIEKLLPESMFYRVHQSHLINLHEIKTYLRGVGGQLILKDGTYIPVARTRKEGLMKRLFDV